MGINESYNIKYEIVGREDGRWVIKAFDRNGNQIGVHLTVKTPSEAGKIYMMLNGYSCEPVQLVDDTEKAS